MRILHLISQRPDSTGSGIYIQEMIDASARNGYENRLVAGIQEGQLPTLTQIPRENCSFVEFGSDSLPMQIVGMSDVMPYPSNRFRDLSREEVSRYEHSFACAITPVISAFQPHILHSHHLWLLSSLTARMFPRIPLVTTCHGTGLRQFRTCPHLQSRVLSGCRHIQAILALSEPQKEEITKLYQLPAERITVAGGGYNNRLFFQERKPSTPPLRLLYAGKLSDAKGVPWLLKALAGMDGDAYHLDLVGGGDGTEYDGCLELAEKLETAVTVHGSLPQDQLASRMRKAHVMVLPSLFEGLPLIMLEAIASGCRVIATDLPGTREIAGRLNTSYIRLVPCPRLHQVDKILPEAEALFVIELRQALNDAARAVRQEPDLSLTPLQHGIRHFSWEQVFARTQAVYQRVLTATF